MSLSSGSHEGIFWSCVSNNLSWLLASFFVNGHHFDACQVVVWFQIPYQKSKSSFQGTPKVSHKRKFISYTAKNFNDSTFNLVHSRTWDFNLIILILKSLNKFKYCSAFSIFTWCTNHIGNPKKFNLY